MREVLKELLEEKFKKKILSNFYKNLKKNFFLSNFGQMSILCRFTFFKLKMSIVRKYKKKQKIRK